MTDIPTLLNLAQGLAREGRTDEAAATARQAIALDPAQVNSHVALGSLLRIAGRYPAAEAAYREALRLRPGFPSALFGLAKLLRDTGRLSQARTLFEHVLKVSPTLPVFLQARLNLPVIYGSTEEIAAERGRYLATLKDAADMPGTIDPESQLANSWFNLAYHGLDDRPIMEELDRLLRAKAPGLDATADHLAGWRPPQGRRIKVAFVSHLLSQHTIGRVYGGLIAGLDRSRFEVVVAHLPRAARDPVRAAISASADIAIDLPAGVAAQRERLARERLDLLFFPDIGMSPESYLLARARVAPVQAVGWGHPDTTGLSSLDYYVSFDGAEPPGAEAAYTERLVRLDRLPCYYEKPAAPVSPGRAALGLPQAGRLYGCLQSLFKLHPDIDALLAGIVERDPTGWLVFAQGPQPSWEQTLRARWAERFPQLNGRAVFLPRRPVQDYLATVAEMDVHLDPPHFGSGNTFYDAMVTGVPVVTWPGAFARGRIVAALYAQMGAGRELVVERLEDYAGRAVAMACDLAGRDALRARLREAADRELFGDARAVQAFTAFIEAAVAARGRGETLPAGWRSA